MPSSPYSPSRKVIELVRRTGETPFFVVDLAVLEDRLRSVLTTCGEAGALYSYPVKANSAPEVLRLMVRRGVYMDVCSMEELRAALSCGAPPARITMCGAGFSGDELKAVLRSGALLDLDSLDELRAVASIAPGVEVGIRIAVPLRSGPEDSCLYSRKFGLSFEDIPGLRELIRTKQVHIVGYHLHDVLPAHVTADSIETALRAFAEYSPRISRINFGGGWGDGLSEDWLKDTTRHVQACAAIGNSLGAEQILFEPGEALVGPAGWLITRIRALKRGRTGGSNELIAICDTPYTFAVGSGLVRSKYPVEQIDHECIQKGAPVRCTLFGRNNTPHDLIRAAVELSSPAPGMLLAIGGQGAYVAAAMGKFNSRPVPDVLFAGVHVNNERNCP